VIPDESTLGGRILLCRLALRRKGDVTGKTTQSDLAEAVNQTLQEQGFDFPPFTKVTVSRWESGKTEPSLASIAGIAAVFGCDAGWLAFGVGEGRQSPLPSWVNRVSPRAITVLSVAQESRPENWVATSPVSRSLPRKRR
jgi:transcriptional regulator with XRE-family HTH domain